MDKNQDEYIPALKYGWLTSLYDSLLYRVLRESKFKRCLVGDYFRSVGQLRESEES